MAKKDGAKARSRVERFEVEKTMSTHDAAGYLEGLARGLREGILVIGDEADGLRAAVAGDIDVEVAARRGKRKSRVAIRLAFRSEKADDPKAEPGAQAAHAAGDTPATIPDEMSF